MKKIAIVLFFLAVIPAAHATTVTISSPQKDVLIVIIAEKAMLSASRVIDFQNIISIKGSIFGRPEREIEITKAHEHVQVPAGYKIILQE